MKVDRLFQIVYVLLDKRQTTAKALAEEFQVSTRTIYRDIDVLTLSGIPIYTNKGKGGGIGLLEDYVLRNAMVNDDEKNQLLMSLEAMNITGLSDVQQVMDKLRAVFRSDDRSYIEIDFSDWLNTETSRGKIDLIRDGITSQRQLKISYVNAEGRVSERSVNPLKLVFKKRDWYLYGFCSSRKANLFFKITRIDEIEATKETFIRNEFIDRSPEKIQTEFDKIDHIEFVLSKDISNRVFEEFNIKNIKKLESGNFKISMNAPINTWLHHYLLSFENHLTELKPVYLKSVLKEILEKTLGNYL